MDLQKAVEKFKVFANSKQGRIAIVGSTILGLTFLIGNLGSGDKPVQKREQRKEYSRTLIDEKTRQRYMEDLEAEQQRTQQEVSILKEEISKLRQMLSKELQGPTKEAQPPQPATSQPTVRPSYSVDPRLLRELRALRKSIEVLNDRVNQIENKVEQKRAPISPDQVPKMQIPRVHPPTVRTVKPGQTPQAEGDVLLEDFYPAQEDKDIEKKLEEKAVSQSKICVPQGSFGKVVALTGLSAPTGPRASQDPVPILFAIPDKFIKPNLKRTYEVRDCFALGWGAGDLSSERIKIKVKSISCEIDGERKKIPVIGYVAGPDGKEGIKGILVEKRGQYLAKALMASFFEGLAAVARYSTTVVSISPLGATQTIPPEEAFKYGVGTGASEALRKLSDYYLQLADEVLPVIEVGSGVSGTLVLLKEACEDEEKPKMWKEAVKETKEKFKGMNLEQPREEVKPFYEIR